MRMARRCRCSRRSSRRQEPGLARLPWPPPAGHRLRRGPIRDQSGQHGARAEPTVFAAALDPRTASLVRLETDSHRGSGFYVRPRLVATTADLVGSASMVDITTSDGEKVLGLVVHTDPARNLAVDARASVRPAGGPLPRNRADARANGRRARTARARSRAYDHCPSAAGAVWRHARGAEQVELDLAGAPATAGAPVFVERARRRTDRRSGRRLAAQHHADRRSGRDTRIRAACRAALTCARPRSEVTPRA